jgi:hypothetical protein
MTFLRRQNKRISRFAPFGWDFSGNGEDLLVNGHEQAAIARIKALRAAGWSLWRIARELKDVPTKTGAPWSATVVRGILRREAKLALAA